VCRGAAAGLDALAALAERIFVKPGIGLLPPRGMKIDVHCSPSLLPFLVQLRPLRGDAVAFSKGVAGLHCKLVLSKRLCRPSV
jgi:hypothetical protein